MKTKKSQEFVERALSLPRAKFAVVGKGHTWVFYEGADLAKAAAEPGESLLKGTCKKKGAGLVVQVIGGPPEIVLLKTKVFAAQLKNDASSIAFKVVSAEDNAQLERLLAELHGPLVEQIGQQPGPQREALLPLYNQALDAATEGNLAGASAKVMELKAKLAPPRPSKPLPPTPTKATTQTQPPQPTAKTPAKPLPTPPTPQEAQARALARQILQIAQALQPTSPDEAQSLLADTKTCMAEPDAARRIEKLQALLARALELQNVDEVLAGLPRAKPPADDGSTLEQLDAEVWALLRYGDTAPADFMAAWQALSDAATDAEMLDDDEKLQRLRGIRDDALKLKARGEQQRKLDALYYELLAEDRLAVRAILAEMAHFPPDLRQPKRVAEFRERFKKASADDDGEAMKALLQELDRLPDVQQYKSEAPAKARLAIAAIKKVSPPEKLKDLPVEQRIDLLMSLRRGGGVKDDECRAAIIALQKAMTLEPAFLAKDDARRKKVLANLQASKVLQDARRDWHLPDDDDEARKQKRLASLQAALQIQCEEMDMPIPPVELFEEGPTWSEDGKELWSCGGFEPQAAYIRLNSQAPIFDDFDSMLDTIIHENTHNYQQKLIDKLEAGTLSRGSPEYNQAVLFQLNQPPLGYLGGTSDGYEEQSTEEHAWKAGTEAKQLFAVVDAQAEANVLLAQIDAIAKRVAAIKPGFRGFDRVREGVLAGIKADTPTAIRIAVMAGQLAFNAAMTEALT